MRERSEDNFGESFLSFCRLNGKNECTLGAEPPVSRGMVVLKRFCVSSLPELSDGPASQASSLSTPGLLYPKPTLWLPFVMTVGGRPQRWHPWLL